VVGDQVDSCGPIPDGELGMKPASAMTITLAKGRRLSLRQLRLGPVLTVTSSARSGHSLESVRRTHNSCVIHAKNPVAFAGQRKYLSKSQPDAITGSASVG